MNWEALTHKQHQATSASRFHRTGGVTPLELFIKQKNAEYAKDCDITLHAPNGKTSNLTQAQWLAVRLLSFKKWFGDWENDPANAGKVVDANGEPLVVYHCSLQWFTEFNSGQERHQSGAANRKPHQ